MELAEKQQLDRQFLINHLGDVRALETVRLQLQQRIDATTSRINALGKPQSIRKPMPLAGRIAMACGIGGCSIAAFACLVNMIVIGGDKMDASDFGSMMLRVLIFFCIGVLGGLLIALLIHVSKNQTYRQRKQNDNVRLLQETQQRNALIQTNATYIEKINEAIALLNECYAINMIPMQFRNIEGVAYLHEFLSTSQETLQSAMLNYNSEFMKRQLADMMQMQSEMVRQQYITNESLQITQRQNEEMIQRLKNIEGNSAQTAKYVSISAVNTRAMAFMQTVDFLRR